MQLLAGETASDHSSNSSTWLKDDGGCHGHRFGVGPTWPMKSLDVLRFKLRTSCVMLAGLQQRSGFFLEDLLWWQACDKKRRNECNYQTQGKLFLLFTA